MRNYNATYYVKPEVGLNGKPIIWVYAHYPTTEPDTPYMIFDFVENAEMFCRALNAENNHVPCSIWIDKTIGRKVSRSLIKRWGKC